jgi:hypothetical protein
MTSVQPAACTHNVEALAFHAALRSLCDTPVLGCHRVLNNGKSGEVRSSGSTPTKTRWIRTPECVIAATGPPAQQQRHSKG